MNDTDTYIETWVDVGVYPTPVALTSSFVNFTKEFHSKGQGQFEVLDLFAGDGRLGSAIISNNIFSKALMTYVEVRSGTIASANFNGQERLIQQNAFEYKPEQEFDLVVSNPPYLSINAEQAIDFGFTWDEAKKGGRNLYGLGILKAITLCRKGKSVSVIAPFGYLRGVNSAEFRREIESNCSEVIIRANSDRALFEGAHQDVAFQLFKKRTKSDKKKTKWRFAYNNENKYASIHVHKPLTIVTAKKYVRVGPVVWNRKRDFLTKNKRGNYAIIYGGNITHDGTLKLPEKRYVEKQFIQKRGVIPTDVLTVPFIAIRRTLRGRPGSWNIDSVLVRDCNYLYTAENHVIVAELPSFGIQKLNKIKRSLIDKIDGYYFHSGSPNISTKIVGELYTSVINEYL